MAIRRTRPRPERGPGFGRGGRATRAAARPAEDPGRATDPTAIRAAALVQLARRDFASGELRTKLIEDGFDDDAVAAAIGELLEEGALNDVRYVENFVSFHASRGHGPYRIRQELRNFGLPEELVEAALASGADWNALASTVRTRKFGAESPADWAEKARQARFLQYRGFSTDHIRSAMGRDFDP